MPGRERIEWVERSVAVPPPSKVLEADEHLGRSPLNTTMWVGRMKAHIVRLNTGEGERWRSIRLQALEESPHAFGTTYSQASRWDVTRWEAQVVEFATFIAVVDGRDVGVARGAAHRETRTRELISMWVAPAMRRQGIGAHLIEAVAAWAKAAGATALALDVVAGNESAISVYERLGFQRFDDDLMGERGPNEIRFVRSLLA
jgi:GNAT superfamily N-acetyltransferase